MNCSCSIGKGGNAVECEGGLNTVFMICFDQKWQVTLVALLWFSKQLRLVLAKQLVYIVANSQNVLAKQPNMIANWLLSEMTCQLNDLNLQRSVAGPVERLSTNVTQVQFSSLVLYLG